MTSLSYWASDFVYSTMGMTDSITQFHLRQWDLLVTLLNYYCSYYYNYNYNHFTALWILSGTTQVSWYQKKHLPTHTYPKHQSSFIYFLHLLQCVASSLFSLRAWQSFCTTSVQVFFDLPPLYSIYFFTQSLSSFRSTCPYHCNLFCCSTEIISSNPSLSHNSFLGTNVYIVL